MKCVHEDWRAGLHTLPACYQGTAEQGLLPRAQHEHTAIITRVNTTHHLDMRLSRGM